MFDAQYRGEFYLSEDRSREPKELFKLLAELIASGDEQPHGRLLDVGCATGELLFFLGQRYPRLELHGLDVVEAFIARSRALVPTAHVSIGSLEDEAAASPEAYDFCVVSGVLSIFDDIKRPLSNILTWLAPGGSALIASPFNAYPIDVVMRYRRAADTGAAWEKGWNIFSRATVDRVLTTDARVARWEFVPFNMPFAIAARQDPMRTWTIETEENPLQLVNGARQLIDIAVLQIVKL